MEIINLDKFVHLLFANQDDLYATNLPVMMSFKKFVAYNLMSQNGTDGIKNIYFIDSRLKVEILAQDKNHNIERKNPVAVEKPGGLLGRLGRHTRQEEQPVDQYAEIRNICEVMKDGHTAVILTSSAVCKLCSIEKQEKLLTGLNFPGGSSNQFIVICSTDLSQLKDEFKAEKGEGLFSCPQLTSKKILPYHQKSLIMEVFSSEQRYKLNDMSVDVMFLNSLDYRSLLNMTECFILKNKDLTEMTKSDREWMSAVIYAWHRSMLFRCFCVKSVPFRTSSQYRFNPQRKYSEIWSRMKDNDFFDKLLETSRNIAAEFKTVDSFLQDLKISMNGPQPYELIYDCENNSPKIERGIANICKAYGSGRGFAYNTFMILNKSLEPIFDSLKLLQSTMGKKLIGEINENDHHKRLFDDLFVSFEETFSEKKSIENIKCAVEYDYAKYFEKFILEYIDLTESYDPERALGSICLQEYRMELLLDQIKLLGAASIKPELLDERGVLEHLDTALLNENSNSIDEATKWIRKFRNDYYI